MTDKFQNKYRIPSARASWWNYGDNGGYFIAICTKNRQHYFGEIVISDDAGVETQCIASLRATPIGQIVETEWLKTISIRPDMNLKMDAFTVMPNHFHAIIWIGDNQYNRDSDDANTDADAVVETPCMASLPPVPPAPMNKFGPQSKNLASILRGFKSAVTTFAVKNKIEFEWQERFYDHIIRDEESYQKIRNYIINNLQNWGTDKFNE